jgi:protein-S-isoprenylcysteine O-methyltransferase Ste14
MDEASLPRHSFERILRKSRIWISVVLAVLLISWSLSTGAAWRVEGATGAALATVGQMFIALCALGRLYTGVFVAGVKNTVLVRTGPFSVVRNPLYVFSLIGFTGFALMTRDIALMLCVPPAFLVMFRLLVRQEERKLLARFGPEYRAYLSATPRFMPRLAGYEAPAVMTFRPDRLRQAYFQAGTWLLAYPLMTLLDVLRPTSPLFGS